jgi:hypothetical protein
MRALTGVGDRFFEPVQIVGGPRTRVIIHKPADVDNPADTFISPHFFARVKKNSLVKPGMVLFVPRIGDHFLIASHSSTQDFHTYNMFQCDRLVDWESPTNAIDPLTKLPKGDGSSELVGQIWVMWQRVRREFEDLNLRVAQERNLIATGADVQLRDTINGQVVDRIDTALGVKICELRA